MPTLPISPVILPSALIGVKNGELPQSVLVRVPLDDNWTAEMEVTAGRALTAMMAAARKDIPGLRFRHVGDYRSLQEQINLFESRMEACSYAEYAATSSSHRRIWRDAIYHGHTSIYFRRVRGASCATPGTSNHGWGLALDIALEYDSDTAPDPITTQLVNWLVNNASRFGYSAELQSESWHWRYYAGDNIPRAVLDYESGTQQPQEGDDVKIIPADRLMDTRGSTPVAAQSQTRVSIPDAVGQKVAQVTFTAIDANLPGFLTVWASGERPETSFLNFPAHYGPITETLFVPLDSDGSFWLYSESWVHLLIDSTGILFS